MRRSTATTSDATMRRGSAQPLVKQLVAAAGGQFRRRSSSTYRASLYAVVVAPGIWQPGARNAGHARVREGLY